MKEHELKILPKYFKAVVQGAKNFEIRRNDRDYKVGDILILKEFCLNSYTGLEVRKEITYILKDSFNSGVISKDYVILSIK